MKKQALSLISMFLCVLIASFIFVFTDVEALSPNSPINFTKESSNLTPRVGEIYTYTLSFNATEVGSLPINVQVIDPNPVPTYLSIIPTSVTGGGIYDPDLDGIFWEGTLVPGSLPHVITFQVLVTGIPAGVPSYEVTNTAVMINVDEPGSLPFLRASVIVTLYPESKYMYLPMIVK